MSESIPIKSDTPNNEREQTIPQNSRKRRWIRGGVIVSKQRRDRYTLIILIEKWRTKAIPNNLKFGAISKRMKETSNASKAKILQGKGFIIKKKLSCWQYSRRKSHPMNLSTWRFLQMIKSQRIQGDGTKLELDMMGNIGNEFPIPSIVLPEIMNCSFLKSVISSLPIFFFFSFYLAPPSIIKSLCSLQIKFLWSGDIESRKVA